MGSSGQRSRTSKTIGTRRRQEASTPGTAMVSGVLVAKTRSVFRPMARRVHAAMNFRKALILVPKDALWGWAMR